MIREHFAAVKARIETDTALAGKGYDSVRLDGTGGLVRETYWILYGGGMDELDDNRFTSVQRANSRADLTYTVRAVANTADLVRSVTAKASAKLVGFVPVVAGRKCDPIRMPPGGMDDVEDDNSVKPPMFYQDTEYVLRSSPAA